MTAGTTRGTNETKYEALSSPPELLFPLGFTVHTCLRLGGARTDPGCEETGTRPIVGTYSAFLRSIHDPRKDHSSWPTGHYRSCLLERRLDDGSRR
jgi:hypothetical protein